MIYRIAGLNVQLEGLDSDYVKNRMKAYASEGPEFSTPDLRVSIKENNDISVPTGRDFRRLDAWYWIERSDGYSAVKQFTKYRFNLVRMDIDKDCKNASLEYIDIKNYGGITTGQLIHHCLGELFAFCQTVHNATVLHSAAVAFNEQAVLFSAPSETGKSTHSGLWKKIYGDDVVLFNDDTPVIRPQGSEFLACGTPWSGKTEINENRAYPLKGIVFLKQAKTNTIRKLTTIETAVKMLNETKKPVFEALMDKHVDIINEIIAKTPVYELGCTISDEAVELVKKTLFWE